MEIPTPLRPVLVLVQGPGDSLNLIKKKQAYSNLNL